MEKAILVTPPKVEALNVLLKEGWEVKSSTAFIEGSHAVLFPQMLVILVEGPHMKKAEEDTVYPMCAIHSAAYFGTRCPKCEEDMQAALQEINRERDERCHTTS